METMGTGQATNDNIEELVAFIARSIVDDPTQVQVDRITGRSSTELVKPHGPALYRDQHVGDGRTGPFCVPGTGVC